MKSNSRKPSIKNTVIFQNGLSWPARNLYTHSRFAYTRTYSFTFFDQVRRCVYVMRCEQPSFSHTSRPDRFIVYLFPRLLSFEMEPFYTRCCPVFGGFWVLFLFPGFFVHFMFSFTLLLLFLAPFSFLLASIKAFFYTSQIFFIFLYKFFYVHWPFCCVTFHPLLSLTPISLHHTHVSQGCNLT